MTETQEREFNLGAADAYHNRIGLEFARNRSEEYYRGFLWAKNLQDRSPERSLLGALVSPVTVRMEAE